MSRFKNVDFILKDNQANDTKPEKKRGCGRPEESAAKAEIPYFTCHSCTLPQSCQEHITMVNYVKRTGSIVL